MVIIMTTQTLSSAELKLSARKHMLGNYGTAIGAFFLIELITWGISILSVSVGDTSTLFGNILYYAVYFLTMVFTGVLTSGQCYLYLNFCCQNPMRASDLFTGCKIEPGKAVLLKGFLLLLSALCFLPSLPGMFLFANTSDFFWLMISVFLLIAGLGVSVYLGLSYSQIFYLLHDFPESSVKEILANSRKLMKGHKGRLFYIELSFIPLYLLGLISFGLGLLWVRPYITATQTEFFLDLMKKKNLH